MNIYLPQRSRYNSGMRGASSSTRPPQHPAADIDLTVLDQFLALSPTERLELHDQWLIAIAELRAAFDAAQRANA